MMISSFNYNYNKFENRIIGVSITLIIIIGIFKFINFILQKGIYHPQSLFSILLIICCLFIIINFYSANSKLSQL